MLRKLLGAAALMLAGAWAVGVYRTTVAVPRMIRAAGAKMAGDIAAVREFHDEMDRIPGLSQDQKLAMSRGFIAGRIRPAGPTR